MIVNLSCKTYAPKIQQTKLRTSKLHLLSLNTKRDEMNNTMSLYKYIYLNNAMQQNSQQKLRQGEEQE